MFDNTRTTCSQTSPNRSSRRWNRLDWLNVAVLGLLNLAIRLPFFRGPTICIDEAEYLAKGALAQATGQSGFTFPGMPYTVELFRISADFFGRYNPTPARVAVGIMAWAVAMCIYRWLARDTPRVLAMASATLFVAWNFIFDGAIIDREWPSILAILAGADLFCMAQGRADRRGPPLVFAAGLVTSLSLFFKEQAAYMTLAAPLWLVYKAAETRRWRPWLGQGLFYLCGGLTGGAIYATPIFLEGALLAHIQSRVRFGSVYIGDPSTMKSSLWSALADVFTGSRAVRLFLPAWGWCFAQGFRALRRLRSAHPGDGGSRRDRELLAILYVAAATAVLQMGRQFFLHYFLFWVPFMFIVLGYAAHSLARLRAHRPAGPALAAIILFSALAVIQFYPPNRVAWPAMGVAVVAGLVCWASFRRPMSSRRLVGVVSLVMALLALTSGASLMAKVAALARQFADCVGPQTREFFASHGRPADRIFVWGWRPEFYCASGLTPANDCLNCIGVFQGFWSATDIDEKAADTLMADLRRDPPRYIVAGLPSSTTLISSLYPLHRLPALEQWVRDNYRRLGDLPDCEIYERISPMSRATHIQDRLPRLAGLRPVAWPPAIPHPDRAIRQGG